MVAELNLLEDFVELLLENPTPESILAFRPSSEDEELISEILSRNKSGHKTMEDERIMHHYLKIEGTIALAKTKAMIQLKAKSA